VQALGSDLVFRRASESRAALLELVQETGAEAVVFNHLYDPISLVRDNEVKTAMQQIQVLLSWSPLSRYSLWFCMLEKAGRGEGGGRWILQAHLTSHPEERASGTTVPPREGGG